MTGGGTGKSLALAVKSRVRSVTPSLAAGKRTHPMTHIDDGRRHGEELGVGGEVARAQRGAHDDELERVYCLGSGTVVAGQGALLLEHAPAQRDDAGQHTCAEGAEEGKLHESAYPGRGKDIQPAEPE